MKHHILERFWIGIGVGTVIGTVIMILISYVHGDGAYMPVMPHLAAWFSREVDGVAVQFLLFALIGVVFAEAGIVFTVEKWSFVRKCLTHFFITAVFFVPFLWLCYFWQAPIWQVLMILGNLLLSYVIAWLTSYFAMRSEVRAINTKIEELRKNSHE
ncbi:MAG: DUF3021 domain-containing protein [Clostridia bacterium]|nr:DUF3021 domain-containing protein [Clostridia bacterium]